MKTIFQASRTEKGGGESRKCFEILKQINVRNSLATTVYDSLKYS